MSIVLIALLIAVSLSFLIEPLKSYLPPDIYTFFKENRDLLLGLYYAFLAYEAYKKYSESTDN
jgi:hypothetical protein